VKAKRRIWVIGALVVAVLMVIGYVGDEKAGRDDEATPAPSAPVSSTPGALHLSGGSLQWLRQPSITVLTGRSDDKRIAMVREAIDFWNGVLQHQKVTFRLGDMELKQVQLPRSVLPGYSQTVLSQSRPGIDTTRVTGNAGGDIVIALADEAFVSFTLADVKNGQILIGIRSDMTFPLTLPNVGRNVIAHELGHAIGLQHNSDPATLMCGRPATCTPDLFASDEPKWFPLTDSDIAVLRRLYTNWKPAP